MDWRAGRLLAGVVTMVLAAALVATPALARPLALIERDGSLRVGLTGDYAPYSLHGAGGTVTGADVTMAQSLAQKLGVRLEIVATTWKTLQPDLVADRFDIAMGGVSVTPDRAQVAPFSIPVMTDGKRPITRCADKDRYVSIATIDQPAVRVIVNPGGTNERFAKANFPHAALVEFADNRTIFEEVAAGHADLMVTDGAEVDFQSRRHAGVLCPATVQDTFDHADKAYWMSNDPALKAAVDAWLKDALASGAYEEALAAAAG